MPTTDRNGKRRVLLKVYFHMRVVARRVHASPLAGATRVVARRVKTGFCFYSPRYHSLARANQVGGNEIIIFMIVGVTLVTSVFVYANDQQERVLASPRVVVAEQRREHCSPRLASPRLASPRLASPRLAYMEMHFHYQIAQ